MRAVDEGGGRGARGAEGSPGPGAPWRRGRAARLRRGHLGRSGPAACDRGCSGGPLGAGRRYRQGAATTSAASAASGCRRVGRRRGGRHRGARAPGDCRASRGSAYRDAVLQAPREVETLAARKSAPDDVVVELRAVMRYYEGAVVAWDAIEGNREREHLSRKLPVPDSMTQPYFSNSPVASLLEEFDFLDATVARQ